MLLGKRAAKYARLFCTSPIRASGGYVFGGAVGIINRRCLTRTRIGTLAGLTGEA